MTRARRELIDLQTTPYYHCICRCVRRAFLCGRDDFSGKNFEHRKTWVTDRLTELSKVFAIDIAAYAVMSNHYHLVLRVNVEQAHAWNEDQVMRRWRRLFSWPLLIQRYQQGETTSVAEQKAAQKLIAEWRKRLMDISWYMRSLNEHLARRANEEDQCKGRFWEGRYKSQALLDEGAVLTCMSYVDLNPIRAGIAHTPETSDFTSIQQRIHQWQQKQIQITNKQSKNKKIHLPLMPLTMQRKDPHANAIGYHTQDYLELVDWAGRIIRDDKKGHIPQHIPPILQRLKLNPKTFIQHVQGRSRNTTMTTVIGAIEHVQAFAARVNKTFLRGAGHARRMYVAHGRA